MMSSGCYWAAAQKLLLNEVPQKILGKFFKPALLLVLRRGLCARTFTLALSSDEVAAFGKASERHYLTCESAGGCMHGKNRIDRSCTSGFLS